MTIKFGDPPQRFGSPPPAAVNEFSLMLVFNGEIFLTCKSYVFLVWNNFMGGLIAYRMYFTYTWPKIYRKLYSGATLCLDENFCRRRSSWESIHLFAYYQFRALQVNFSIDFYCKIAQRSWGLIPSIRGEIRGEPLIIVGGLGQRCPFHFFSLTAQCLLTIQNKEGTCGETR